MYVDVTVQVSVGNGQQRPASWHISPFRSNTPQSLYWGEAVTVDICVTVTVLGAQELCGTGEVDGEVELEVLFEYIISPFTTLRRPNPTQKFLLKIIAVYLLFTVLHRNDGGVKQQ